MTQQVYRQKLIEAGVEVHKLIAVHGPAFKEKAQQFMDLFEQWREGVVEGQRVALAHRKPEPAFYGGEHIPPTFKLPRGCEHYKLYDLRDFYHTDESLPLNEHNEKLPYKGKNKDKNVSKRRHVYYGPPLPRNPMDTLRLRDWPRLPWEGGSGLYEKDPRDPEEGLLRNFFLLAVIHAFYSHGQPIIDRDSLAAQLVYEAYQDEDDYCVPDKQALLDTALVDVRARLEQRENYSEPGKAGQGKGGKITKDEANVRVRELLMQTPTLDWSTRKLAKLVHCGHVLISKTPAYIAYHEKRKELRRNKTIDTVSLSRELEAVLGEGEKDEVLNQLIASRKEKSEKMQGGRNST